MYCITNSSSISFFGFYTDQPNADGQSSYQEHSVLFIWQGRHAQISEQDLSLPSSLQNEPRVFIKQGEEPPCFLQLFNGGLIIHKARSDRCAGVCVNLDDTAIHSMS